MIIGKKAGVAAVVLMGAYAAHATDLPKEYGRVEWIGSTGTQYIRTGIVPNGEKVRVDIKYAFTKLRTESYVFGYFNKSGSYGTALGVNGSSKVRYRVYEKAGVGDDADTDVHEVSLNAVGGTVMDGEVLDASLAEVADSGAMEYYVFGRNVDGSFDPSCVRIYQLAIDMDGRPARDFVPCRRLSDGEPGLYDLITGEFYWNAGTDRFEEGEMSARASDVQRLQYAESTGVQYVDTGVAPLGRVPEVKMDYQMMAVDNDRYAFGYWDDGLRVGTAVGINENKVRYRVAGTAEYYGVADTNRHTIVMNSPDGTFIDGRPVINTGLTGIADSSSSLNYYLFGRNHADVARAKARIFSFTLKIGGTPVLNLVPVRLRANGEVGLWDQERKLFHPAKGGTLIAGPEIRNRSGFVVVVM